MPIHSEGCRRLKPLESVFFLPALKRRGFQSSQELLREQTVRAAVLIRGQILETDF
jgi:hypothetical protein